MKKALLIAGLLVCKTSFAQHVSLNTDGGRRSYFYYVEENRKEYSEGSEERDKPKRRIDTSSKFLRQQKSGALYTYVYSDSSYKIVANNNLGSFDLYHKGEKIYSYNCRYTGLVSAYISPVPFDLDTALKTVLFEESISPNAFIMGNYRKNVKELNYQTGILVNEFRNADHPTYAPDKQLLSYRHFPVKVSRQKGFFYLDRTTKCISSDPDARDSFWLR